LSAELRQELQERGHLISSIQIKSDGHHVPWEMILLPALQKEGKSFPAQFLAERYQVTRWTEGWSPPPTIQLNRFVYIAPRYAADQALVHAKDEVQFIESLRPRGVVPERVTALPLPIFDAIDNKPFDVLHFVGHAAQDTEKLSYSTLELETETRTNGGVQRLVPHSLEPVHVENKQVQWGARRPLVFFNACQTGRTDVGLVRPGGWARALLNSKAGVFIGTLWSVRDSAAQLFAKTFYESLLAKQTVGSSALAARRTVAEKLKDPSWLAYVVYAHPNTRAAVGP
jgi:CHAT domain-containing protein